MLGERRGSDFVVLLGRHLQQPNAFQQEENLQRLLVRVHQPELNDPLRRVDHHFHHTADQPVAVKVLIHTSKAKLSEDYLQWYATRLISEYIAPLSTELALFTSD